MKCLRCGYCCIQLMVTIVKPEFIDEDLDFDNLSVIDKVIMKESGKWCPYLELNGEEYSCKVHNKPWYKDTPCFAHTQIENSIDDECRMGAGVTNRFKDHLKSLKRRN